MVLDGGHDVLGGPVDLGGGVADGVDLAGAGEGGGRGFLLQAGVQGFEFDAIEIGELVEGEVVRLQAEGVALVVLSNELVVLAELLEAEDCLGGRVLLSVFLHP